MSLLDINDIEIESSQILFEHAVEDYFKRYFSQENLSKFLPYSHSYNLIDFDLIESVKLMTNYKDINDDDIFVCDLTNTILSGSRMLYIHITQRGDSDSTLSRLYRHEFWGNKPNKNYIKIYINRENGIYSILTVKLLKQLYGIA